VTFNGIYADLRAREKKERKEGRGKRIMDYGILQLGPTLNKQTTTTTTIWFRDAY
jgi:hypothetical protein